MAKRNETEDHELEDSTEESELEGGADEAISGEDAERDSSADAGELASSDDESVEQEEEIEATSLGSARYVHAAFFGAGILAAYICGKLLLAAWNLLADWPEAVRAVPQLIQYGEEERGTIALLGGAVLGVLLVLFYYRKQSVRDWAGEVALELSRVTWPNKEAVTNGTMVVLVASLVATVYVALLDRFWSYLTNLVYGA